MSSKEIEAVPALYWRWGAAMLLSMSPLRDLGADLVKIRLEYFAIAPQTEFILFVISAPPMPLGPILVPKHLMTSLCKGVKTAWRASAAATYPRHGPTPAMALPAHRRRENHGMRPLLTHTRRHRTTHCTERHLGPASPSKNVKAPAACVHSCPPSEALTYLCTL